MDAPPSAYSLFVRLACWRVTEPYPSMSVSTKLANSAASFPGVFFRVLAICSHVSDGHLEGVLSVPIPIRNQ